MSEDLNDQQASHGEASQEIGKMSHAFAGLMQQGVMVAEPKTPEELYANARLSEFSGDFGSARRFYQEYFQTNAECLDPHLRYLQMLNGPDANDVYLKATENSNTKVAELVSILIKTNEEKFTLLDEFLTKNPNWGPAAYFLSKRYSAEEMSPRSLKDKKQERSDLENVQRLDAEGKLACWFLEPSDVDEWRADTGYRLKVLADMESTFQNPVSIRWTRHNNGWTGTISVSEIALELLWKRSNDSELNSTGILETRTYSTGHNHPVPGFNIPDFEGSRKFEIHYRDVNNELIGPFNFELDAGTENVASSKQELNITRSGWGSFRTSEDQLFFHFTHLLRHKNALNAIKYGLNSDETDRELNIPSNRTGIAHLDNKMPVYMEVPPDTKKVVIQVEFKDGELSESTINRPFV